MTHQDIANELRSIAAEQGRAQIERMRFFDAKRHEVRTECANLGHIWGNERDAFLAPRLMCLICGAEKGA